MKTFRQTTLMMLLAISTMTLKAQGPPPKPGSSDKIDALKIAFITNKLALTPDEAKVFWPVYNQYDAEKKTVRQSTIGERDEMPDFENMNDADAQKLIDNEIAFKAKDLDLQKKYVAEFKKVLPVKKVAKLLTLEGEFKKMLIKQMQDRPDGPGKFPPPPPH